MKVIHSVKFETVAGFCQGVVKSVPKTEHRHAMYVIGPDGEYFTGFAIEEYELTDGSKVQNIRMTTGARHVRPMLEPVMRFKIEDINGLAWNDHNRAFITGAVDGMKPTVFASFEEAAQVAKHRELYGNRHEPSRVVFVPCDEKGLTLD